MNKKKKLVDAKRTAEDTTVAELLETVAPPREGTTGAHLVSVGPHHYFLVIQGPEATWLTARLLEVIDALADQALEKQLDNQGR